MQGSSKDAQGSLQQPLRQWSPKDAQGKDAQGPLKPPRAPVSQPRLPNRILLKLSAPRAPVVLGGPLPTEELGSLLPASVRRSIVHRPVHWHGYGCNKRYTCTGTSRVQPDCAPPGTLAWVWAQQPCNTPVQAHQEYNLRVLLLIAHAKGVCPCR